MRDLLSYPVLVVFIYMHIVFIVAILIKDNSIVDIAWGVGFICVAIVTLFLREGMVIRSVLVSAMVSIWGVRLAFHIAIRNKAKGEDFRYAQWRKAWGMWFIPRSYIQIFLLQGILLLVISYPVMLVNQSQKAQLTYLDIVGMLIWSVGFFFETVGDYQLVRFKRNPENKGKIMTKGLWKYSRHPNYFGEVLIWWGIFVITLSVEYGWTAIVSPLLITFLLLKVSGVTMLEKKYAGHDEFAAYAKKTSVFIPRPPKSG